jgi:hypothetical protein
MVGVKGKRGRDSRIRGLRTGLWDKYVVEATFAAVHRQMK